MMKKAFYCDRCGKMIDGEPRMHNNRYVGVDGNLMVHVSKREFTGYRHTQRTMFFCPECWERIFRAVKKVILREDEKGE